MKELGEKLKNARIDHRFDLQDLHNRTKIPISTIKSIEEGEPIQLEKTYYRIFVRSIAKEVDLNGNQLLKELDEREEKQRESSLSYTDRIQNGGRFKDFFKSKGRIVIVNGLALLFVVIAYGYIRYGKQLFVEPEIQEIKEFKGNFLFEGWILPDTLMLKPFKLSLIALKSCHFIVRPDSGQIESFMINEEEEIDWNIQKYVTLGIDEPSHLILLVNGFPITWEEADSTAGIDIMITANGVIHQSLREKE